MGVPDTPGRRSNPLLCWRTVILYFTVPNHVWAVDARTGRQVWHFQRQSGGQYDRPARRRDVQGPVVFRHSRRAPDLRGCAQRKAGLGPGDRRLQVRLLHQRDAAGGEGPPDYGDVQRSIRYPGISGSPEPRRRKGSLALGCGTEAGRTRRRYLAKCRYDGAWRRRDLDSRILRSRS